MGAFLVNKRINRGNKIALLQATPVHKAKVAQRNVFYDGSADTRNSGAIVTGINYCPFLIIFILSKLRILISCELWYG